MMGIGLQSSVKLPRSTQVHVQGCYNSLLDVGDSNGFISINKHGFKDTSLQVNLESGFQVGLEVGKDRLLNLFMSKTIEGQETRLSQFDQKAVVISGLDANNT